MRVSGQNEDRRKETIRVIVSTTTAIDGRPVNDYVGIVTGEAVIGQGGSMLMVSASGIAVKP
jgi:uncharacterized protein YbjQ (UPF0145 family)